MPIDKAGLRTHIVVGFYIASLKGTGLYGRHNRGGREREEENTLKNV